VFDLVCLVIDWLFICVVVVCIFDDVCFFVYVFFDCMVVMVDGDVLVLGLVCGGLVSVFSLLEV